MDTKNQETYIGLDLHKRTSSLCVKTKDGKLLDRFKLKTTWEEFEKTLSKYEGAHIVFESVSQSWWIGDKLEENLGMEIHLANPREVKVIAHARIKNDTIDAEVLCDLLRGNLLPEGYLSSSKEREYKELVRFRTSMVGMRQQLKLKVHATLARHGIIEPLGNIFGKVGRKWLKTLTLTPAAKRHVEEYMELMEHYDEKIQRATREIQEQSKQDERLELLLSIPGISYITALSILSEVGNINRFPSGKKLASYAGLVPSTYASGEKVRHGKITKKGSKWLRTVLIETAHRQGRLVKERGLRDFYDRLKKEKSTNTAVVATARKLCHVIYGVLKNKTPFDGARMSAV